MLNIEKKSHGKNLDIALEGRLDTTTAPELETIVRTGLDGAELLTFDFAKLEYISSAGLRILLAAQKIMNKQGKMIVRNANADIKDIFTVTGFSNILTLE